MKKKLAITCGIVVTFLVCFGTAQAVQTFGDAIFVPSLIVGSQGVGGVTFFNGTIINNTTDSDGDGVPVTFGDDVRIDGTIFRTEEGGTNPLKIGDSLRPQADNTYDLGITDFAFKDLYLAGALNGNNVVSSANITDGVVATADLADNAVTSAKILDAAIVAADLASNSITSAKIVDGAILTADLANDSVTSAKILDETIVAEDIADGAVDNDKIANEAVERGQINGPGGANLPIAYGFVLADGTLSVGTSNVATTWDAVNSRYVVTIDDEDYFWSSYIAIVTPSTDNYIPEVGSVDGDLLVDFITDGGAADQQSTFNFVVFKP